MNSVVEFYRRQYGYSVRKQYDIVLSRLAAHKLDCWRGIAPAADNSDYHPPIFAAKFANNDNHRHILAIANEDGRVAIQNTNDQNVDDIVEQPIKGFPCHTNAVFDVEWVPGNMQFVSASGDHSTSLWQVRDDGSFEGLRSFHGHTRSVKTVAFRRNDTACFATGGRDNAILIWDTRSRSNANSAPKADNCIYRGHATGPGTPQAYKPKNPRTTPKLPPYTSSSSITGLAFQDDYTLVSCGGGDGMIKVWDLRRNYSCYKREPVPKHSIPYPGSSTHQGYSNLLIDSTGQRLYVNCMDHHIYCFVLGVYATEPIISYTGLTNSTFYIKASLSPDDQYLISGSKDEKAYIWHVNNPKPILALVGHAEEVTCVAWGRTKDLRIVTCSDDSRHKIWRINYDNLDTDASENYMGKSETLKHQPLKRSPLKRRLKDLENTPRTLKRIVEVNETTPSSMEKTSMKRNYGEMCGGSFERHFQNGGDTKRQLIETRGRRLFAPSGSSSYLASQSAHVTLDELNALDIVTPPKDENGKLLSPLNERNQLNHHRLDEIRTPSTSYRPSCSQSLFSPTSNLPNYVIDGDAPHLKLQSPKRKLKENIDWLTKFRKQKLSSTIGRQLNEKLNETLVSSNHDAQQTGAIHSSDLLHQIEPTNGILSPRMRKIKLTDRSQRRLSTCQSHSGNEHDSIPATPTRRKSETTLLRYFCRTPTTRSREPSPAAQNHS